MSFGGAGSADLFFRSAAFCCRLGGKLALFGVTNRRFGGRVSVGCRSFADGEEFMTFHLDIPESAAQSLRLAAPEVVPRLRT